MREVCEWGIPLGIAIACGMAFLNFGRGKRHEAWMVLGVDYATVVGRGGQLQDFNAELARVIPERDLELRWKLKRIGVDCKLSRQEINYTCDIEELRTFWSAMLDYPQVQPQLRVQIEKYIGALGYASAYFFNTNIIRLG